MIDNRPPRVLITRAEEVVGERWEDYAVAIERFGAVPVTADLQMGDAGLRLLSSCEGLMVTAGVDIDPQRYGEPQSDRVSEVNSERDAFEESLLATAREKNLPILAICRGHQIFNTSRGGTLLQHLEEREPHRARRGADGESIASGWHDVAVAPGSLLAQITKSSSIRVNSRHHQAVLTSTIAPGLVPTGTAEQDVVEALEDPRLSWALSIQWHPERPEMLENESLRNSSPDIFEAFVAACAAGTRS